MKKLQILFAIALSVCIAQGGQKSDFNVESLGAKGREGYQKLLVADVFRVGGVGIAGQTSDEELALYDLLEDKQAIAALTSLVSDGTYEGGLYGLLGLSIANIGEFNRMVEVYKSREQPPIRYITKKGNVAVQFGCVTFGKQWLKVVTDIQSGFYEVRRRKNRS